MGLSVGNIKKLSMLGFEFVENSSRFSQQFAIGLGRVQGWHRKITLKCVEGSIC